MYSLLSPVAVPNDEAFLQLAAQKLREHNLQEGTKPFLGWPSS
jgi:hypothetical protein